MMIGSYWAMSIFFAGTIAVFYYFRYGYIDATQLYLPMKFSTPFDESTIIGWFYVLIAGLITASVYGFCNVSIVAFFMSMGMYFSACRMHYQSIFAKMNQIVHKNNFEEENVKLKRLLGIAVKYHNSIKG